MPAVWQAGALTVPSSTGDVTVTGLGGTPQLVLFFGTNWLTEDTAVTTDHTGLFRGMACGTDQSAAHVTPAGDAHFLIDDHCILAMDLTGAPSALYSATLASFDSDGFTVHFDNGEAGGYKVVWCALYGTADIDSHIGGSITLTLGWKAGSSLLHGAWQGPAVVQGDRTQEWYGGGAYPGGVSANWFGAGLSASTFPTSTSAQYDIGIFNDQPNIRIATAPDFIGPFLSSSNVVAYPSGGSLTNFVFNPTAANNQGMVVVWDDEDSQTGRAHTAPANTGNTATFSLPFDPGLVIGYSISDEPPGLGTGGRGAVGFSVATKELQWCAIVDGNSSRGSFQSFQRGFADAVSGTSVHAGTVTLAAQSFTLETAEDDVAARDWVWHAFGHPKPFKGWMPHIYRQVFGGGGAPAAPFSRPITPASTPGSVGAKGSGTSYLLTGYVLLETGDKILLEEGTGSLLL